MRLELTRAIAHHPLKVACIPISPPEPFIYEKGDLCRPIGAKNGTRTRDPDLGKVVLYQLSYFRIIKFVDIRISILRCLAKVFYLVYRLGQGRALPTELFSHIQHKHIYIAFLRLQKYCNF